MGSTFSFDSNDKYISGVMYSSDNEVVGYFTSHPDKNEYIPVYHKHINFLNEETTPSIMDRSKSFKFQAGFFLSGIFYSQVPDVNSSTGAMQHTEYHITNGTQIKIGDIKSVEWWVPEMNPEYYQSEFTCGQTYVNQFNRDEQSEVAPVYTGICIAGDKTPIPIPLIPVFVYNPEPDGPIGMKGPTGWMGPMGVQGIKGDIGPRGPIGERGSTGPTGTRGEKGLQGIKGLLGIQGPPGLVGTRGDMGIPGLKFGSKKYKNQLNVTSALTFILLIYILLWVSSVGAMIGVTGGAPTSIGDAIHTITGGMINV
jgi:hypothetical protein